LRGGLVVGVLLSQLQQLPDVVRKQLIWMRRLVLIVPIALVLSFLAEQTFQFLLHGISSIRPWTLGERLLTEARIVCDYLALLWLPHPYTAGLFNDAIKVSTGLLSPPSTLLAICFLAVLFGIAVALRRRAPVWSLAILFYFAGHLLESSVIPLELYYEHRNYLPAMLLFWPLALWLTGDGPLVVVRRALAVVLPLMLAGMTFLNADLWGDAQQQALVWGEKNPESPRAQAYAAAAERARGRPDLAAARMRRARVDQLEDIQIALNQVGAECEMGKVSPAALARAQAALRTTRTAGRLYYEWVNEAIGRVKGGDACDGLGKREIESLLDAMADNPKMSNYGWRQDNLGLHAMFALAQHDPKAALAYFNEALDADPRPTVALAQAAQLGSAGYPAEGLAHLDHFESIPKPPVRWTWSMASVHAWLLQKQGFTQSEIAHLRGVLKEDVATQAQNGE
jgi:tetratricopeptide (TPR) repeat protein